VTKKRKRPATAPEPPPRRDADDTEAFAPKLEVLFDHFFEHGCPCRFPRFRATVLRDTREVGAPDYTTWEQQALVALFDRRVPLLDRENRPVGHEGRCASCGSHVERWGVESFRDAWIEYLRITPAAGVPDTGAELHTPVPHCWPFFRAGPPDRSLGHIVDLHYPKVSQDDWLAWIRELRA
jgi:hypothetical protein